MSDTRYALSALTNRLKLMIGRGRVQTGKDDGPVQVLQVILSPKETPDLKRVGEFGFASWPMPGCDAVVMFVSGDRSNGVIIGTNDQAHRFKLENPGEAALFDGFGKSIWLKKDGGIVVEANGEAITVNNAAGITINSTEDITLNMGGKNVIISNPGTVELAGTGGKKVVLDGDSVIAGKVVASSTKVTAK